MKAFFVLSLLLAAIVLAAAQADNNLNEDEYKNVLSKFEHFIKKFGHKALSFLKCVGPSFLTKCAPDTLKCAAVHDALNCMKLMKCESHDVARCIGHLH